MLRNPFAVEGESVTNETVGVKEMYVKVVFVCDIDLALHIQFNPSHTKSVISEFGSVHIFSQLING